MSNFLVGPSIVAAPGLTSDIYTTPYPVAPGSVARDTDGNEYVFCSCVTAVPGYGILVSITPDHQVAPLLHTSLLSARVGVASHQLLVGEGSWIQVYGVAFVQGNNTVNIVVGGTGASTDATSIGSNGSSTSEMDARGMLLTPQLVVTSPTGTLGIVDKSNGTLGEQSSLVSDVSNVPGGGYNPIRGMYLLSAAQVSNLPDSLITAHWPSVTSPVSAVSNTTGPVTLTTYVSGTTGGHIGGEWIVYLNYPVLSGDMTS